MEFRASDAIEVKAAEGKGLGVFAVRLIRKGEVIERVPMLVLSASEYTGGMEKTLLSGYVFAWGNGEYALALGYGSIYNHSYTPNARYDDLEPRIKEFTALKTIKPGQEITVNYNGSPTSRGKLWFNVTREPKPTGPRRKGESGD